MMNIGNDRFWQIVDKLDWESLCKVENGKLRKEKAFQNFKELDLTPLNIEGFHQVAIACRKVLQDKVEEYSLLKFGDRHKFPNNSGVLSVSDDGFWDLCAHIVGLGKKAYENVCENPEKILEYSNYVENFEYLFNSEEYQKWLETDGNI